MLSNCITDNIFKEFLNAVHVKPFQVIVDKILRQYKCFNLGYIS